MCNHEHLRFEDGTLHLVCIDCNQVWQGVTAKNGQLNHSLSANMLLPLKNTRHDRWVLARTLPKNRI